MLRVAPFVMLITKKKKNHLNEWMLISPNEKNNLDFEQLFLQDSR